MRGIKRKVWVRLSLKVVDQVDKHAMGRDEGRENSRFPLRAVQRPGLVLISIYANQNEALQAYLGCGLGGLGKTDQNVKVSAALMRSKKRCAAADMTVDSMSLS